MNTTTSMTITTTSTSPRLRIRSASSLQSPAFILCVLLAAALFIPSGFAQIYVSTTGNDTTGNGTSGNPYRTVGKGVSVLNTSPAGTDLLIAPGTYTEDATHVVTLSGTAADPVRIAGNGGQPLLQNMWFILRGVSHVQLTVLDMNAGGLHPACILAATVTSCTVTLSHLTGADLGAAASDPYNQALAADLMNHGGVAPEAGLICLYAINGLYLQNVILDATTWVCVYLPNHPGNASGLTIEDCTLTDSSTGTVPRGLRFLHPFSNLTVRRTRINASNVGIEQYLTETMRSRFYPSQNWTIQDCYINVYTTSANWTVYKPCLAIRSMTMENVLVKNCQLISLGPTPIYLRGNSYNGYNNLTFENCTVREWDAYNPLVPPYSPVSNGCIRTDGVGFSRNITFRNCYVKAARFTTLDTLAGGMQNWTLDGVNAIFYDLGLWTRNSVLANCVIRNCSWTGCRAPLFLDGSLPGGLVEDSVFTLIDSAVAIRAGEAPFCSDNNEGTLPTENNAFQNTLVRRCTFTNQRGGHAAFTLNSDGSRNFTVQDCLMLSTNGPGVELLLGSSVNAHYNFLMQNCTVWGASGATHLDLRGKDQVFRNCTFDAFSLDTAVQVGSNISAATDTRLLLDACTIRNFKGVAGLSALSSAPGLVVKNCLVSNGSGGAHGLAVFADSVLRNTTDVTFLSNTITGVEGAGILIQGASHAARGNVITRCGAGIRLEPGSQSTYRDLALTRNAVYGASPSSNLGIEFIDPSVNSANLTVVNNTITNWVGGLVVGGAHVRGLKAFNNIFTANTTGVQAAGSGNLYSFNGYYNNGTNATGITVPGTGDVLADPVFLSSTPGDPNFLRLSPGSPMVDMGSLDGLVSDPTPDVGDDIDLGWWESAASGVDGWRMF